MLQHNLTRIFSWAGRQLLGTITHVETHEPVVALTFDDGPDPEQTPRLLDILDQYQAKATFFMVGERACCFPDLVREVAKRGHAIGNHSWDHPSFPYLRGSERRQQLRNCQLALSPYIHSNGAPLFRPPYGNQSWSSRLDAFWMGYQVIAWNIVACDWEDHGADWMQQQVEKHLQPGSIVLFHDGLYHTLDERFVDRSASHQAVAQLLECYHDSYRFVTVPTLLKTGRPRRKNWLMKAEAEFLNRLKPGFKPSPESGPLKLRQYP